MDVPSLLQSLNIKDALLRQLEAALVLPPPPVTNSGLSRRAAGLVANAQRREAVLQLKLKGLQVRGVTGCGSTMSGGRVCTSPG